MALRVNTWFWRFTTAQTNVKIKDVSATEIAQVFFAKAICANSNTGNVSVRCGLFGASGLPTLPADSLTPTEGEFLSHGGIAKGGGEVNDRGNEALAIGRLGEDIWFNCSAPDGGDVRLIIVGRILTGQDQVGET
jgi:hypothetical protein